MAYSKFTWDDLHDKFGIKASSKQLFDKELTPLIYPNTWLSDTLKIAHNMPMLSEKARSESIVYPILATLREINRNSFTLYSGIDLNADKKQGLSGECDFLLGSEARSVYLTAPIFTALEAKQENIPRWIPQAVAQMLGARTYNQKRKTNITTIYGCVTTGTEWQFLLLEDTMCWVDTDLYSLDNLPKLLGTLQTIVDFYR